MPLSMSCLSLAPDIIVQANKLRPSYSSEEFFKLSQSAVPPYGFLLDSRSTGFTQSIYWRFDSEEKNAADLFY